MDGLEDDADIVFILTTNRPDILEPALASRPGAAIDQAIEIPPRMRVAGGASSTSMAAGMPLTGAVDRDLRAAHRRRERGLHPRAHEAGGVFAADEGDGVAVEDRHVDEALHELVVQGGELTRSLLGAKGAVGRRDEHC